MGLMNAHPPAAECCIRGKPLMNPTNQGAHAEAQRSGFGGERTSIDVSEPCESRESDTKIVRTKGRNRL